jgi:hypothetical protein
MRIDKVIIDEQLGMVRREEVVAYFKVLSHIFLYRTEETVTNFSQDCRYPSRDSSQGPSKNEPLHRAVQFVFCPDPFTTEFF